jgi:hypothetical protein
MVCRCSRHRESKTTPQAATSLVLSYFDNIIMISRSRKFYQKSVQCNFVTDDLSVTTKRNALFAYTRNTVPIYIYSPTIAVQSSTRIHLVESLRESCNCQKGESSSAVGWFRNRSNYCHYHGRRFECHLAEAKANSPFQ